MKGLVYITDNDPTECAWMIANKFDQLTDMDTKELARKIIDLNEGMQRVSMGFFRKPDDDLHDYINPYQLVFVPTIEYWHNEEIAEQVAEIRRSYPWEFFREIREAQEKGVDIHSHVISHNALHHHNEIQKKQLKGHTDSWTKQAVDSFAVGTAFLGNLTSELKAINFYSTYDSISKSIENFNDRLVASNLQKLVQKRCSLIDEIKNFKKAHLKSQFKRLRGIRNRFKAELQTLDEQISTIEKNLTAAAEEVKAVSEKNITKATEKLFKLATNPGTEEEAVKMAIKEGKGLSLYCFQHPMILKGLSIVTKPIGFIAKKANPLIMLVAGAWDVHSAYEERGKDAALAKGVSVGITLVIGGFVTGAIIMAGLPVLTFIGVSLLAGLFVSAIGKLLYEFSDWLFEKYHVEENLEKFLKESFDFQDKVLVGNALYGEKTGNWILPPAK